MDLHRISLTLTLIGATLVLTVNAVGIINSSPWIIGLYER